LKRESTLPIRAGRSYPDNLSGYLFAAPWLIGFLGLTLLPMIASVILSFTEWNGINLGQMEWVGFENYRQAATDENVWISLYNTAYYSFLAVPIGLGVALFLAVLLSQKLPGITIFRTIFYMPAVIGGVGTIMMWIWIFNPDFGLLNMFLRGVADFMAQLHIIQPGWEPPLWLYDPRWSKPSLILMSLWGTGGAMLIFLAALQNVSEELYEASYIDGATRMRQFWHITVPQISPAIFFNLVMGVIGSFQVFSEAYIMTDGGPARSTLFYVLYLYNKAFLDFEMGYASALAWILFVIIFTFTLLVIRSGKLWVYYEGER